MKRRFLVLLLSATWSFAANWDYNSGWDKGLGAIAVPPASAESGGFKLCSPYDFGSVDNGWRYVLRYVQSSWPKGPNFNLFIVREPDGFVLALFDENPPSSVAFAAMSPEQKIVAASVRRRVDDALVNILYATWVKTLLQTRFSYSRSVADGDYYYISSYVENAGYLCASSIARRQGSPTEYLVEVGLLLQKYAREKTEKDSITIREKILFFCEKATKGLEKAKQ